MSLEDAALRFKAWAAEQGILSYESPEELDRDEDLDDLTDAPDVAAAEQILRHRKINFVGINDADNKIVVATHLKLTNKERSIVPELAGGEHQFEYLKAHPPVIKSAAIMAGPVRPYTVRDRRYCCGSSVFVGHRIGAGTFGALVRGADGTLYGLSNNHVTGGCNYSEVRLPILAPGALDVTPASHDPFTIGHHTKLNPLQLGTPDNIDSASNIDAAIFEIRDEDLVTSMQRDFYDTPSQADDPMPGMLVEKVGRTTGRTKGQIVARSVGYEPVQINIPQFNTKAVCFFSDMMAIEGRGETFADVGDSGSLVVSSEPGQDSKAVGLVFAVSADRRLTFMTPIKKALELFDVELCSRHNVAANP